jgi:hypothetical protein
MSRDEFDTKVNAFLESRNLSAGGWAPCSQQDLDQLSELINGLISLKFEADPDGDVPVQFRLINRTQCWPLHFHPLLYEDKQPAGTTMTHEDVLLLNLQRATGNLREAARQVDQCQMSLVDFTRERKERK